MCLDFAPVFCVLLFACTSHLMLYNAAHNEYMSTAVFNYLCLFICNVTLYIGMYTMRVVLVGHTIVVPNTSYIILSYQIMHCHEVGSSVPGFVAVSLQIVAAVESKHRHVEGCRVAKRNISQNVRT